MPTPVKPAATGAAILRSPLLWAGVALLVVLMGLAGEYDQQGVTGNAAALQQMARFAGGLRAIAETTSGDAQRARHVADNKLVELGQAERRRAVVETRAQEQARLITKAAQQPVLGARRQTGTELD